MIWCVVPLLYGFLSVSTFLMVPQKCQYRPKSGSVPINQPPNPGTSQLQEALDTLPGLIDRFGLHTNIKMTVGVVFQLYRYVGIHAVETYSRRMTGERWTYR